MSRGSQRVRQRERRKQDLLLASAMAREQAAAAISDLELRADHLVAQVGAVRHLFQRPSVRLAGGLAALLLGRSVSRSGPARLLRWAMLGWRAWQALAPLRAQRPPPG